MSRLRALRATLLVVGFLAIFSGALFVLWPSGFRWRPYHPYYEEMIVGIYVTLGVFLVRAAKDPLRHLSLIWFTVWSSVVHGAIMAAQALSGAEHHGHLVGDVPFLFVAAAVLGVLTPRRPAGAEEIRRAFLDAALRAYDDAGMQGLCADGRWEAAVSALRSVDPDSPLRESPKPQ